MTILECLQVISDRTDCGVASTEGLPQLSRDAKLPPSLVEFYTACGGVTFGKCPARPYLWRIVPPSEFKPAGFAVSGVQEERQLLGHWSDSMYLFATTQFGEERIVVDCGGDHHGVFFNGDHETFATAEMLVIAFALPDLLIGLSQCDFEHLPHVMGMPRLLRLRELQTQ